MRANACVNSNVPRRVHTAQGNAPAFPQAILLESRNHIEGEAV